MKILALALLLLVAALTHAGDKDNLSSIGDLGPDVVAIAFNDAGGITFLTTYHATKPDVKMGVHCEGPWHVAQSGRPKLPVKDLWGCWSFTDDQEITIVWAKDPPVTKVYDATDFQLAKWFVEKYPQHAPPDATDDSDQKPDTKL